MITRSSVCAQQSLTKDHFHSVSALPTEPVSQPVAKAMTHLLSTRTKNFAMALFLTITIGHAHAEVRTLAEDLRKVDKPSTVRPTILDLASVAVIGSLTLSPDQSKIAFLKYEPRPIENEQIITLLVASTKGGSVTELADAGSLLPQAYIDGAPQGKSWRHRMKWSPDGNKIAFIKGAGEVGQLWSVSIEDKQPQQLTNDDRDVLAFAWSSDSETLFFHSGESFTKRTDERVQSEANGILFDEAFYLPLEQRRFDAPERPFGIDDDAFIERYGDRYEVRSVLASGGQVSPATESEKAAYYASVTSTADIGDAAELELPSLGSFSAARRNASGEAAVWMQSIDDGLFFGHKRVTALSTRLSAKQITCMDEACYQVTDEKPWISPDGEKVVFNRPSHGNYAPHVFYVWDIRTDTVRLLRDEMEFLGRDCVLGDEFLFCPAQAPSTPFRLVSVSLADGSKKTLYDPNPKFKDFELPRIETFRWEIEAGKMGIGDLIYPYDYEPGKPYPLLLACYSSGRFLGGGSGDHTPFLEMARRGYFVLQCALADHYDREAMQVATDFWDWHRKIVSPDRLRWWAKGAEAAANALAGQGLIDREKIAMAGFSNGAYTTAAMMIETDLIAAASVLTASLNGETMLAFAPIPAQEFNHTAGTGPETGLWDNHSLAVQAERVDTPLMIHASESELLNAVLDTYYLRRSAVPVELFVYKGENHSKTQPRHKLRVYERAADWLDFWIRGFEDPDARKADQYLRWKEMRAQRCTQHQAEEKPYWLDHCDQAETD